MFILVYTTCALLFILIGWIFGPPAWKISLGAGVGMFLAGVILQIFYWWFHKWKNRRELNEYEGELAKEWLEFRTLIRTNRDKKRNHDKR